MEWAKYSSSERASKPDPYLKMTNGFLLVACTMQISMHRPISGNSAQSDSARYWICTVFRGVLTPHTYTIPCVYYAVTNRLLFLIFAPPPDDTQEVHRFRWGIEPFLPYGNQIRLALRVAFEAINYCTNVLFRWLVAGSVTAELKSS